MSSPAGLPLSARRSIAFGRLVEWLYEYTRDYPQMAFKLGLTLGKICKDVGIAAIPASSLFSGPDSGAGAVDQRQTMPLLDDPGFRRAHNALHALWTKADESDYDKAQWRELDNALEDLGVRAVRGSGQ